MNIIILIKLKNDSINVIYFKQIFIYKIKKGDIEVLNSCLSKEMSSYGGKGLAANINFDDLGFEDGLVESIIVSAEVRGESVYSITTIKSSRDLTTAEKMKLKEDITGQFSDGFGEGFEQRAIADWMESYEVEEEGYEDEDGEWVDGESHLEPMVHELYAQLWTPETTYTFE